MLCDGAKGDCALKISTCTAASVQAALMAVRGMTIPPIEGIVDADPEKSILNLARLGVEGSPMLDGIILDVMVNKARA
jgi:L-cysteine desulfidase